MKSSFASKGPFDDCSFEFPCFRDPRLWLKVSYFLTNEKINGWAHEKTREDRNKLKLNRGEATNTFLNPKTSFTSSLNLHHFFSPQTHLPSPISLSLSLSHFHQKFSDLHFIIICSQSPIEKKVDYGIANLGFFSSPLSQ